MWFSSTVAAIVGLFTCWGGHCWCGFPLLWQPLLVCSPAGAAIVGVFSPAGDVG